MCLYWFKKQYNTVMESDQVHFILFNVDTRHWKVINDSNVKMSKLVKETLGITVLDSACSETIVRKRWFDIFFDMFKWPR